MSTKASELERRILRVLGRLGPSDVTKVADCLKLKEAAVKAPLDALYERGFVAKDRESRFFAITQSGEVALRWSA